MTQVSPGTAGDALQVTEPTVISGELAPSRMPPPRVINWRHNRLLASSYPWSSWVEGRKLGSKERKHIEWSLISYWPTG